MLDMFHNKRTVLPVLLAASLAIYAIDYLVIGSGRDVFAGLLGNLAFLPLYVLFVTLIVEQIMRERERQTVMRKLNMVIGVFFSEVGNRLLSELSRCSVSPEELRRELKVTGTWQEKEFQAALQFLDQRDLAVNSASYNKHELRDFLRSKRDFMVGLLENQSLLEHERFTDLLWAVFHLTEELEARVALDRLPQSDLEHLNGDMKRVFAFLAREWVMYMRHLKSDYPFLFSLAVRLNPLNEHPDATVY